MGRKKTSYTREQLENYGLIETIGREIKRTDLVDVSCYLCNSVDNGVSFDRVLDKNEVTKGNGWRCRECYKDDCSRKASLRSGENSGFYGKKHSEETMAKIKAGYQKYNDDKEAVAKSHTKRLETTRTKP